MSEQLAANYRVSLFTRGVFPSDSRIQLDRPMDVEDATSFGQTLASLQRSNPTQTVARLPLTSPQAPEVSKFFQDSSEGEDSHPLSLFEKSASALDRLTDSDRNAGGPTGELPITLRQTTEGLTTDCPDVGSLAMGSRTAASPDTELPAEAQRVVAHPEARRPVTEPRAVDHLPIAELSSAGLPVTEIPAAGPGAIDLSATQRPVTELPAVGPLPATERSSAGLPVTEIPAAGPGATDLSATQPPVTGPPAVGPLPTTEGSSAELTVTELSVVGQGATGLPVTQRPVTERPAEGHLPVTERLSAELPVTDSPVVGEGATDLPVIQYPVSQRLAKGHLSVTELRAADLLTATGSSNEDENITARTTLNHPVTEQALAELQQWLPPGLPNLKSMLIANQTETVYPKIILSEFGKNLEMAPADRGGGLWVSNEAVDPGSLMTDDSNKVADLLTSNTVMDTLRGHAQRPVIDVPLGQPRWDQSLSERVLWLVNRKMQGAELQLNPPHLGPLGVQLSLDDQQMSVKFATPHALVREALESAIPRLREMLNDSGLILANVDVSQQNLAQQRHERSTPFQSPNSYIETNPVDPTMDTNGERTLSVRVGLVNYFA